MLRIPPTLAARTGAFLLAATTTSAPGGISPEVQSQDIGTLLANASGQPGLELLSTTPDWSFESNQADALLGNWVATAGDVNGDGYDEVLVSAPRFDNGEVDEGMVFLFMGSASGLDLTPAWTFEADQANAQTRSARSAGDLNGDGFGDVVVGVGLWDNDQVDEGRALLFLGLGRRSFHHAGLERRGGPGGGRSGRIRSRRGRRQRRRLRRHPRRRDRIRQRGDG